jgi:RNA recognition motif-containing protein
MAAMQGAMQGGIPNRTVYLGGLHPETTMEDLCNHIRGGIIEQIKLMPEKHCAFITFVDPSSAVAFYNTCMYQGFVVRSRRARPGWGKPSPLSSATSAAVHAGATRNVYLGSIDETITEDRLRNDFSRYGSVETVNIIRDKNIAFVNFTCIANAVRAVNEARQDAEYSRFKINYGKDRCANPPRSAPPTGGSGGGGSGGGSSQGPSTSAVPVAVAGPSVGGEEEEEGEHMNEDGQYGSGY